MAQVTIRINGYAYTVGCEDGQETHLQAMAGEIDERIAGIKALGGQTGEVRLLMLAALLMADEVHDLKGELARLQSERPAADPGAAKTRAATSRRLARLADRAEEIAAGLDRS